MAVSWARTDHLPVGAWKEKRPVYQRGLSPCLTHCPVGNDVEGYIRLVLEGDHEGAARLLAAETPFPATCGRVCYHPCETGCNRTQLDSPVGIRAIERYLGDLPLFDSASVWSTARDASGKRVAVVGAGPAGMSAAWALTLLGHSVELFDRNELPGGLLRYGIPSYRLPKEVLDREINRLKELGIRFIPGTAAGNVKEIRTLLDQYDSVFLASGAATSRSLGLPGESETGQINAIDFLHAVVSGERVGIGSHCIVIGGGNSAVDAARSARRLGAEVTILYRRTRKEMPAFDAEITDAIHEGVELLELAIPHELVVKNGAVKSLTCIRTKLGPPDESGRRSPVPIPDSHFNLPATMVINAIGEQVDLQAISSDQKVQSEIPRVEDWGDSAIEGLFAGGDITVADRTVAHAIGSGKRAAMAIDRFLLGNEKSSLDRFRVGGGPASLAGYLVNGEIEILDRDIHVIEYSDLNPDYFPHVERKELERLIEQFPGSSFEEVERGLSAVAIQVEAERCFSCGKCTHCGLCQVFCPEGAVRQDPETGDYMVIDSLCKGCGICAEECPRCALTMEWIHERRE